MSSAARLKLKNNLEKVNVISDPGDIVAITSEKGRHIKIIFKGGQSIDIYTDHNYNITQSFKEYLHYKNIETEQDKNLLITLHHKINNLEMELHHKIDRVENDLELFKMRFSKSWLS